MSDDPNLPSLSELDRSIKKVKKRLTDNANPPVNPSISGMSLAWRICIELVVGVAVGCFIGYYLDIWLGTKPFLFIICFFLGTAGSGLNIYRMVQKEAKSSLGTLTDE